MRKPSSPKTSQKSFLNKFISSLIWLGTLPLCLYTILTYVLSYSLVIDHWLAGFIMMTMPYAQILCFISFLYWLFQRAKRALLPLTVLLLGYSFIQRSIVFNSPNALVKNSVKVLSYNVYGMYSNNYEAKKESLAKLKSFMLDYSADIKCFQEFYSNSDRKPYRSINMMIEQYPNYAFIPLREDLFDKNEKMGLAIFTKYPIIHKEGKQFANSANGYLLADLVINQDTVRIINLQLWSMGIRVGKVTGKIRDQDYEDAKKEAHERIEEWKKENKELLRKPRINHENHDTIGMLALDEFGNISGEALVTVLSSPIAQFNAQPDSLTILYTSTQLIDKSIGNIINWSWDLGTMGNGQVMMELN